MIKKQIKTIFRSVWWLLLLSWSATAIDLSDWKIAAKVTVTPNSTRVFQLSDNNNDADIAVLLGDRLISIQNGPESRLACEFVLFESSKQSRNYQILIRDAHKSGYALQWKINEIPARDVKANRAHFNRLHQAARLWEKGDEANQAKSSLLLKKTINKLPSGSTLYAQAVSIYGRMLLADEQFQAAFDIADKALVHKGKLKDQLAFKLKWIQADAMLELDKREMATELYEKLVADFEVGANMSHAVVLAQAQVRGNYGLAYILRGHLRGSSAEIDKGKMFIEQANQVVSQFGDYELQANFLNYLWTYYAFKGDFVQGEKVLLLALEYSQRAGAKDRILEILNHLSLNYRFSGQLAKAQHTLRQALSLVNSTNRAHTKANFHNNMAVINSMLGDNESAKRFYQRALKIYQDGGAKHGEATVYKGLGKIAREQGNLKLAIDYHSKSLTYFKTVSNEHAARLLIELSRDYFLAGDFGLAKLSAERALNLPGDIVLANDIIDSLIIFAKIAWHEGNNEVSLAHLNRIQTEFKDKISPEHRLELTRLQIEHSLKSGDVEHLTAFADAAIAEIEKVRQSLDTAKLGPAWTNKTDGLVSQYIAALMQLGQRAGHQQLQQKVFQILAQNHAINLRERRYMLAQNSISKNNAAKSSEKDQQLILLWERSLQAERLIVSAESKSAKKQAMNHADDAREAYLTYAPQLAGSEADADLAYLSIDEIQAKLQPTEMFIRYYVRDNITFAFVITADGWQVMDIPDRDVLMAQGQRLISALKKQQLVPEGAIRTLTKLLPLKMLSKGTYRRLIIVHDDILNTIPFSALNIAVIAARYKPLVSKYEIVRAYSAGEYFADNLPTERPHKYDIAVFADPVFDKERFLKGERNSVEPDQFRSWAKSLSRLPSTAKEAAAIGEIYAGAKVKIVMGVAATNKMLMSDDMRNAGILHIASHGYFSESTPDIVGIATSVIDEHNNDSPGFLTLTELLSKPFSSRLVVVSGCETLLGKQLNGEGLNGLTRGLLSQGAGSVISTLWSIPDKPTAEFMKTFYTYLKQHNGNSVKALNLTKVKFSRHKLYRHPLYWAGFVLTAANKRFALPEQWGSTTSE